MNKLQRSFTETKSENLKNGERGSTMVQLIITVAIIAIVSTFALINFRSARATIRLQNSTRQLASYMEKARLDAVRRHGTSSVEFTSPTTYTIQMDFNNSGSPVPRTFSFEQGVQLATSELPSVTFNWRGRAATSGAACITTFSIANSEGGQTVDVSGAGDVTVESQQPTLQNISYDPGPSSTTGIKSQTIVSGATVNDDNTPCLDQSGGGTSGDTGPTGCIMHYSTNNISIKKNGGSTGSVVLSMSTPSMVAATFPSNLTVSPTAQSVSTGSSFSIRSNSTLRGPFDVMFNSQCGASQIVRVNVTN
jgi:type IV fimbrial biogenesis protein FimT